MGWQVHHHENHYGYLQADGGEPWYAASMYSNKRWKPKRK